MSILRKLFSLGKGAVTEAGQAIVDSQALRILDQEIRDAETALDKARDELAKLMARRALGEKKVEDLAAKAADYESKGVQALKKGDEALARDVAELIGKLEAEKAAEDKLIAEYRAAETRLRATVSQTETRIQTLKREVDNVRATEAVQTAQAAVAAKHAGVNTALGDAAASLERLKQKQAERDARFKAAEELDAATAGSDLDSRLSKLGIGENSASTEDILARFKAKE